MAKVLATTRAIVAEGVAAGELRDVDPVLTHLVVIGSGPGGYVAAIRAAQLANDPGGQPRQLMQFGFFTNSGGIPIVVDGEMIGAVGVGGGAGGGGSNAAGDLVQGRSTRAHDRLSRDRRSDRSLR